MIKKRDFKKSVLVSWTVKYLAILGIPIILFLLFIAVCISILTNETSYYNGLAVAHVKSVMDRAFLDVNASATELFMDDGLKEIATYKAFRNVPAYLLYDEFSALQRTASTKQTIEGLLVYSPSMDLYITDSSYGRLSNLPTMAQFNLHLSAEKVAEIFSSQGKAMEIHDASFTLVSGKEVPRIIVTRPLNYVNSVFYVAAIISTENIFGSESEFGSYHNVMIYSSANGDFVFDLSKMSSRLTDESEVSLDSVSETGSERVSVFKRSGSIVASAPSNQTNFTYVIKISKAQYYHVIYVMYALMFAYIVIALLVSGLFSLRRMKKDWLALESAIDSVGADTTEARDIYAPFVSSVSKLEQEKAGLGSVIERQTASIKSNMLKSLVSGTEEGFVSKKALEECGLSFPSDSFMVMIIETIKEADDVAEKVPGEKLSRGGSNSWVAEAEKAAEMACDAEVMHIFPFSSQYGAAILISFTGDYIDKKHDVYADMTLYVERMGPEFASRVAASDLIDGIENIGTAYISAISTMEYKSNMNIKELVFSRDVSALNGQIRYIYSQESAFALSTAVSEGNGDSAVSIIREVYKKNKESGVSSRHLRYLLFAMSNDILKLSVKLEDILGTSFVPFVVPNILQTQNPDVVRVNLEENVISFCSSVVSARNAMGNIDDDSYRIYQRAVKIIDERFRDPMLNVSDVANSMDLSLTHISKIFKKYHRMNISDYISRVRVEAAKGLLERGVQLQDIASTCGFGSLRTFMRVFHKLEGITPGQYRSYKKESDL